MTTAHRRLFMAAAAFAGLLLIMAMMANLFNRRIEPGLLGAVTGTAVAAGAIHTVTESRDRIVEAVPASVAAAETTLLSSRILARIKTIPVTAGQRVATGDVLVRLESSDLDSRVAETTELTKVGSARLQDAQLQLRRISELFDKKLVSRAEIDTARSRVDALSAELASVQYAREQALATSDYSRILAPIDGVVVDRFAEVGDMASPGQKLLSIYNPASMRVEAQVREQLALSLEIDQKVEVQIPSLDLRLPAVIAELVPAAEPGARSFRVKANVPLSPHILPGMFARLLIPTGEETRLLIPMDLVTHVGQLDLVWVVDERNQVRRRLVRLGDQAIDNQVVVLAGLRVGEHLVHQAEAETAGAAKTPG